MRLGESTMNTEPEETTVGASDLSALLGDQLGELKRLAEDVTGWSNCNKAWLDDSEDVAAAMVGHIAEDGETYPVATIDCDQYYAAGDSIKLARFYAAANPKIVLAMLGRIDELKVALRVATIAIEDRVQIPKDAPFLEKCRELTCYKPCEQKSFEEAMVSICDA